MREHIEIQHHHEKLMTAADGRQYAVAYYEAEAQVEVIDGGYDWRITDIAVEGVAYVDAPCGVIDPAGMQRPTRKEVWVRLDKADPLWAELHAAISPLVDDAIAAAWSDGRIGPQARRAAMADYRREDRMEIV